MKMKRDVSKRGANLRTINAVVSPIKHSGKTAAKDQKQGIKMDFDITKARNTKTSNRYNDSNYIKLYHKIHQFFVKSLVFIFSMLKNNNILDLLIEFLVGG